MLRRVALVRTDISKELSASIIRVTRIGELGITLAVTSNRLTLMKDALSSSETSILTRAIRLNIPEDNILHVFKRCILALLTEDRERVHLKYLEYDSVQNNIHGPVIPVGDLFAF
jgi:hypothetical protein